MLDKPKLNMLRQLDRLMVDLAGRHDQLLTLMQEKRAALKLNERDLFLGHCDRENALVQTISELEKRRLELVAQLTQAFAPESAEPLRLQELAERMPEPHRGKLLVRRQELLTRMKEAQRQSSITRRATESLLKHMAGLMNGVCAAATGTGAYGQFGAPTQNPVSTAVRSLNLTA